MFTSGPNNDADFNQSWPEWYSKKLTTNCATHAYKFEQLQQISTDSNQDLGESVGLRFAGRNDFLSDSNSGSNQPACRSALLDANRGGGGCGGDGNTECQAPVLSNYLPASQANIPMWPSKSYHKTRLGESIYVWRGKPSFRQRKWYYTTHLFAKGFMWPRMPSTCKTYLARESYNEDT